MSDSFERKLQSRLENATRTPRPEVWSALESRMAASRPRRRLVGWWLIPETLLVLVCLSLVWGSVTRIGTPTAGALTTRSVTPSEQDAVLSVAPHTMRSAPSAAQTLPAPAEAAQVAVPAAPRLHTAETMPPQQTVSITHLHDDMLPASNTTAYHILPDTPPVMSAPPVSLVAMAVPTVGLQIPQALQPDQVAVSLLPPARDRWSYWASVRMTQGMTSLASLDHSQYYRYEPLALANSLIQTSLYVLSLPRTEASLAVGAERILHTRWRIQAGVMGTVSSPGTYQQGVLSSSPQDSQDEGFQPVASVLDSVEYGSQAPFRVVQLQVPLRIGYSWTRGRHSFTPYAGVLLSRTFVWRDRSIYQQEFSPDPDTNRGFVSGTEYKIASFNNAELIRFQPYHVRAELRLMYEYRLRSSGIYAGPTLSYSLRPAYTGLAAGIQPRYFTGVEIGFRWGAGR